MRCIVPVAVNVGGTKREAVVEQRRVDHESRVRPLQQVTEVTQMSMAPSHPIPGAVFIQDEHLTWTEPSLQITKKKC